MRNLEYTNIELERAKAKELKRTRQAKETLINTNIVVDDNIIDSEKFTASLDSMTKVEDTAAITRYVNMPVIEFDLAPGAFTWKRSKKNLKK